MTRDRLAQTLRAWWGRGLVIALDLTLLALAGYVHTVNHQQLLTVQIAVGSEDLSFFMDPRVRSEFAAQNLDVQVTPFGSGQIAESVDPRQYDAFFVSSQVFADLAQLRMHRTISEIQPFTTPLAVFTWRGLVDPLRQLKIVNRAGQFDIGEYMRAVQERRRWSEAGDTPLADDSARVVLRVTNPTQSDSGAMFTAAASYLLHGDSLIADKASAAGIAAQVVEALSPLGEMQTTTNQLFQDYRRGGMNGAPMILGYRSERSELPEGGVMLPLSSNVDCEHTVLPLNAAGERLASLLASDPVLQRLAVRHGFETASPGQVPVIPVPVPPVLKAFIDDLAIADGISPL